MSHLKFVVVGHPNKGKSSIVATLTHNESVAIGPRPGTTTKARSFYLKSGDEILYELIDTPGFQRPKKLLDWLKSQGEVSANERPKLLKRFIQSECPSDTFRDECELLKPIAEGAAILYVVDASKPYSSKFEAEMEILRYAARPSMAILNYIGEDDYTKEWQAALRQYFSIIKPFNPLKATFEEHIDLLYAMRHIAPDWSRELEKTIKYLREYRRQKREELAAIISQGVCDIVSFKLCKSFHISHPNEEQLHREFQEAIEEQERLLFERIKEVLGFQKLQLDVELQRLHYSIFSKESEELFGLSKEKIVLLFTLTSAATGGAIDLAVGGHSLLLGTIIGGALGFIGANYGYGKLSEINFLSSTQVEVGPIQDLNIGFIVLNRALEFAKILLETSHANRERKEAVINDQSSLKALKKLASLLKKCQKGSVSSSEREKLKAVLLELL